jgi:hypothetical protein
MALALGISTGQVDVRNATSFARQLDTDLATVGLNRTAVGFGAGDATLGWRFFPRVQSPPPQNNLARIAGLLVNAGPGANYLERNRKIEPGLRECVAMVVVPNFVPSIRLTTSANWFETTGRHADQKFSNRDYLVLSRKLQRARAALTRVCDAGEYRPGELARLTRRLDQLEALLPTQDYRVSLPDEGDLSGSEIFASNSAGLAPKLLTWYGEFPMEGEDSRIFLLGTGFSVLETEVIAGGVPADDVKQLSRNVLEITISSKARPVGVKILNEDKVVEDKLVIDVHVATPNGVSNHLLVQAYEAPKQEGGAKEVTTTVTTTTSPDRLSTSTTIRTTPPGIVLPQGTVLPLGTYLPGGMTIAPNGGPSNGGTVPSAPKAEPASATATPANANAAPAVLAPAAAPALAPAPAPAPQAAPSPEPLAPAPAPESPPAGEALPTPKASRTRIPPPIPADAQLQSLQQGSPSPSSRGTSADADQARGVSPTTRTVKSTLMPRPARMGPGVSAKARPGETTSVRGSYAAAALSALLSRPSDRRVSTTPR